MCEVAVRRVPRGRIAFLWSLFLVGSLASAIARETSRQRGGERPWNGHLGGSLLTTGGNSETVQFGVDVRLQRVPRPWGGSLDLQVTRASQEGVTTAERYFLRVRGERSYAGNAHVFLGFSGERDVFAGFSRRYLVENGAASRLQDTNKVRLVVALGLTWTAEMSTRDGTTRSLGGLLDLGYRRVLREGLVAGGRMILYPDFRRGANWRVEGNFGLSTQLVRFLAIRVSSDLRYDHEPVPGFRRLDQATQVSVVYGI